MAENRTDCNLPGVQPTRHTFASLSYLEWRPPSDDPKHVLLLLHGLGDNAWVWGELGAALAASGCLAIAPDLPGHGDSAKPTAAEAYEFATIARQLAALLVFNGCAKAYAIGHSWGGKLVAAWLQARPQWFLGAVLVDPFFNDRLPDWLQITFPILYRTLPFLQGMGPFTDRDAALNCGRRLRQYSAWSPWQQQAFQAGIEAKPTGEWGSKFTPAARDRIFMESLLNAGLSGPVDVPALLVLPERGLNRCSWQLQPYHRYLQQLQVTRVPGNHWPHLDAPESLQAAIAAFLGIALQPSTD
ncbi:MAG: alpha/beta fold hydrolase [Cyanobacteria bacterium J06641_5]